MLEPEALTAIVNTGDDFEYCRASVVTRISTALHVRIRSIRARRRGGVYSPEETFARSQMVRRYGGDDWFALGDRDLATHLVRSEALRRGETLGAVTRRMTEALGVRCRVLPMADAPCRTILDTTTHGLLPFQIWFVRHRAQPPVKRVLFEVCRSAAGCWRSRSR